jgi:hypothetical protein
MKRISLLLACSLVIIVLAEAQEAQIRARVESMFTAMYARDTTALRACFVPAATLYTYSYDSKGHSRAKGESITDFIRGVALIGEAKLEERLMSWQILIDEGVASVWTPYEFYFEDKFSHCGINSFQLMQVQGDWKITQITDTRRKANCVDEKKQAATIDSLINVWHHAAAVADENTFFGFMSEDGIYIGTDATERWLRDDLKAWSKKYFDREAAWDFTPLSRTVTIGPGNRVAWFDETLDTWMGVCRSTGILEMRDDQWKLVHYQLSVAVPNDKIDAYKALIGKE